MINTKVKLKKNSIFSVPIMFDIKMLLKIKTNYSIFCKEKKNDYISQNTWDIVIVLICR